MGSDHIFYLTGKVYSGTSCLDGMAGYANPHISSPYFLSAAASLDFVAKTPIQVTSWKTITPYTVIIIKTPSLSELMFSMIFKIMEMGKRGIEPPAFTTWELIYSQPQHRQSLPLPQNRHQTVSNNIFRAMRCTIRFAAFHRQLVFLSISISMLWHHNSFWILRSLAYNSFFRNCRCVMPVSQTVGYLLALQTAQFDRIGGWGFSPHIALFQKPLSRIPVFC